MAEQSKPFYSKMESVLSINIDGIDLSDPKEQAKLNLVVEKKIKEYVDKLKSTHSKFEDGDFGPKEVDKLGASSLYGTTIPAPAGSKYPRPEDLRWDRPLYDDNYFSSAAAGENGGQEADADEGDGEGGDEFGDDEFGDDEFGPSIEEDGDDIWCKHGSLFVDDTSSNDVIQGQLGDCWFLGALAVMGAHSNLLRQCFWKFDSFKNYGLFVVRFFKGCEVIFVIIDDRIPVKNRDGKVIFAMCKDPNELWVPLIEKAYAKLHGCYKALIGGYSHNALADMTGFSPRLMVLKPGFTGYSESLDKEEVWKMLWRYKQWNCLMGTSIQSSPKANHKVEAEAGLGLHMGHAYSFLDLNTIQVDGKDVRLVKLRNPWGRGEWEGAYGDRSEERERQEINEELEKYFEVDHEEINVDFMDGTFMMPFDAWIDRFTSLFVAMAFPDSWKGMKTQGTWTGESGGNREMGSWVSNPKIKFKLQGEKGTFKRVFVGLYTNDSRLTLGFDYYKDPLYATPLAFDVITAEEFELPAGKRKHIPRSRKPEADEAHLSDPCPAEKDVKSGGDAKMVEDTLVKQAPYNFGSTQVECFLEAGVEYYLVPFLYKRTQPGTYYLNVHAECPFELEGGAKLPGEQELMRVGTKSANALEQAHDEAKKDDKAAWAVDKPVVEEAKQEAKGKSAPVSETKADDKGEDGSRSKALTISKAQFYEKAEQLRERFVKEAKKLGVSVSNIKNLFVADQKPDGAETEPTYAEFKRRLMDIGFSLTDLPDEDLLVLDKDNSGTISPEEFIEFFKLGLSFDEGESSLTPPTPPVDDLVYKAADLEGVLSVKVLSGKNLRKPAAWFEKAEASSEADSDGTEVSSSLKKRPVISMLDSAKAQERWFTKVDFAPRKPEDSASATGMDRSESKATLDSPTKRDTMHGPHSPTKSGGGDDRTVATHFTASSMAIKQGKDSAIKLHSSADLQKAEERRAGALQALKKSLASQAAANSSEVEKTSTLRKQERTSGGKTEKDITKDRGAMAYINKNEARVLELKSWWGSETIGSNPSAGDGPVTAKADSKLALLPLHDDMWDEVIDRVVTICECRENAYTPSSLKMVRSGTGKLNAEDIKGLSRAPSMATLPTPTPTGKAPPKPFKKGTAPTPKTLKKYPGTASVSTARKALAGGNEASTVTAAASKLAELNKEEYTQVYRRLRSVPMMSTNEYEGDRERHSTDGANSSNSLLVAFANKLFNKFDKNLNGFITLEEFKTSLQEMNINVNEEDTETLFNRFETSKRDGTIDWEEFLRFFQDHIVTSTGEEVSANAEKSRRPMAEVVTTIWEKVSPVIRTMELHRWSTVDDYHRFQTADCIEAPKDDTPFEVPCNAIFHRLNTSHVSRNLATLRQLGVEISETEMKRVNRVFSRSVRQLMTFLRNYATVDVNHVIAHVNRLVVNGLEQRVGGFMDAQPPTLTSKGIKKLWSLVCPSGIAMRFDEATAMVMNVLTSSIATEEGKAESTPTSSTAEAGDAVPVKAASGNRVLTANVGDSGEESEESDDEVEVYREMNMRVLSRFVVDYIIESAWNDCRTSRSHNMSFSAFEAYVRQGHVKNIETKLKYLMQLEMSIAGPKAHVLVYVYLNKTKTKAAILVEEPLKGEIYAHEFEEDLSFLPDGTTLRERFTKKVEEKGSDLFKWCLKEGFVPEESYSLYNDVDTPEEEAAIAALVSRLIITRSSDSKQGNKLVVGEDQRFVSQLSSLLDASPLLPFFFSCNNTSVYFEVNSGDTLESSSGIRRLVFNAIRSSKPLCAFMTNVISTLNVILTSYNSGIRITLSWREMVAHLTGYRNPFVTVELKPKFLQPHEYIYKPDLTRSAFDGEENDDPLAVQRSSVITDGSSHPSFDAQFGITFQPPKLTTCKLLCTEIHRMVISSEPKYIILMVREAKRTNKAAPGDEEQKKAVRADNDSFRFITIYDPRSATDYQCGVKEDCRLYEVLMNTHAAADDAQADVSLETFKEYLVEAVEEDKIILGPAITPRLVVTVWNERDKHEEMLGSCEMSISAVLSGSGVGKTSWVTLTHTADVDDKRDVLVSAGDVQVDLSFRKLQEIENEQLAERDRLKRKKESHGKATAALRVASASLTVAEAPEQGDDKGAKESKKLRESLKALESEKQQQKEQLSAMEAEAAKAAQAAEENLRLAQEVQKLKLQLQEEASKKAEAPVAEAKGGSPDADPATAAATAPAELQKLQGEKDALLRSLDSKVEEAQSAQEGRQKAEDEKRALEQQLSQQADLLAEMKAELDRQTKLAASSLSAKGAPKAKKDDKSKSAAPAAPAAPAAKAKKDKEEKRPREPAAGAGKERDQEVRSSMDNLRQSQEKGEDPLPPIKDSQGGMVMSGSALSSSSGDIATVEEKEDKLPTPKSPSREASSTAGSSRSPSRHVDWDEVPLPDGWDRRVDPGTKMTYYVDHVNKKTQWKHPLYKKK